MTSALLLAILAGHLEVVGPLSCPQPSEIRARLADLLSPEQLQRNHLLLVDRGDGARLYLWVFDPQGRLLTSQAVGGEGDCANQALAVAALAAAWETAGLQAVGETESLPPRIVIGANKPSQALPAEALPSPGEAQTATPSAQTERSESLPAEPWHWAAGAGAGAQVETTVSPAVVVGLRAVSPRSFFGLGSLGLALTVEGALPHRSPYLTGAVRWSETALRLSPTLELVRGQWGLMVALEGGLGARAVTGESFARDISTLLWVGGVGGSARLDYRKYRLRPWLLLQGVGWMQREQLFITRDAPTFSLPQFEIGVALGADLVF